MSPGNALSLTVAAWLVQASWNDITIEGLGGAQVCPHGSQGEQKGQGSSPWGALHGQDSARAPTELTDYGMATEAAVLLPILALQMPGSCIQIFTAPWYLLTQTG